MDLPILIRTAIAIALLASCEKHSALYCDKHPSDLTNCAPVDGNTTCTASSQCSAPTPVCEVGSMTCVQCLVSTDCTEPTAPLCGANHMCHGCFSHTECASNACLPDGSCGAESEIAYVVSTGGSDSGSCPRATPCRTIAHASSTGKPIIDLVGPGTFTENVQISGGTVTIVGDQSVKLTDSSNSSELQISGTAQVSVFDFQIGGNGGTTACVELANTASLFMKKMRVDTCDGFGVATTGGSLVVERSTFASNIGGGIKIGGGTFDITNAFITKNGNNSTGTTGAAQLTCGGSTCRFEFNTVVDNLSRTGVSAGVACDFSFAAPNNIIAHNRLGSGGGAEADTTPSGMCTYPDTTIRTDLQTLHFVSATDYHITAGSVAIDTALTPSPIDIDRDGDQRPVGPAKDQGADELR